MRWVAQVASLREMINVLLIVHPLLGRVLVKVPAKIDSL
jgi:hypothetical protein